MYLKKYLNESIITHPITIKTKKPKFYVCMEVVKQQQHLKH